MIAQFPDEVAARIQELITDEADTLFGEDYQIFYGDQSRIGITPTICVESGVSVRRLGGIATHGRTENELTTYVIIYYGKVDSNQETKLASDQLGKTVAKYLDTNTTLERDGDGGIVIHGWVTEIDPGYISKDKGNTLYHAVRLTWTGKSKTILGA